MKPTHKMTGAEIAEATASVLGWEQKESPSGLVYYDKGNGKSVGVPIWLPHLNIAQANELMDFFESMGRAVIVGTLGHGNGWYCEIEAIMPDEDVHLKSCKTKERAICEASIEAWRGPTERTKRQSAK